MPGYKPLRIGFEFRTSCQARRKTFENVQSIEVLSLSKIFQLVGQKCKSLEFSDNYFSICQKKPLSIVVVHMLKQNYFSFKLAELFAFSWTFGLFLCKFVNYMQNVSAVSSVLNLTVMSIER